MLQSQIFKWPVATLLVLTMALWTEKCCAQSIQRTLLPANELSAYGWSLAVDGSRIAVGAFEDSAIFTDAGALYVYDYSRPAGTEFIKLLRAPQPLENGAFGRSIAIAGNLLFAFEKVNNSLSFVHAYDITSNNEAPVFTIAAPDVPENIANFGLAINVWENILVIGAPGNSAGTASSGRVFVYDLASANRTEPVFELINPNPNFNDKFGGNIAVNDGRVVVGATGFRKVDVNEGEAYVYDLFSRDPTTAIAILTNPTPNDNEFFGNAVACEGEIVAVGALMDRIGNLPRGGVYVYDLTTGSPAIPYLTIVNPDPPVTTFGRSVALQNYRLMVGATDNDGNIFDVSPGLVYIYELSSTNPLTSFDVLESPSPDSADFFGWSMATTGDALVVSALGDDTFATNSGAVYLFANSAPGDVNHDGEVGLLDVAPFVGLLVTQSYEYSADINFDGSVDLLDVDPFVGLLGK